MGRRRKETQAVDCTNVQSSMRVLSRKEKPKKKKLEPYRAYPRLPNCISNNKKLKPRRFSCLHKPCLRVQDVPVDNKQLRQEVEHLFSGRFIQRVIASAPNIYRERILTIEVVMLALLNFVLAGLDSFLSLVDRLRTGEIPGLRKVEATPAAFYKRLRAISHNVFLVLLQETTKALNASRKYKRDWVKKLAPFANGIYAIDDTTLDALMRRTKSLKKFTKGSMETLGGRLGCALDLLTGAFVEVLYDSDSEANEKNHIRPLIDRLGLGNMYVFDLGYFAFPFFDYLTEHYCYFVSRLRNKTTYKVIQTLAEGQYYLDRIVYLGKYRADQASYPVRMIELLIDGTWYKYITNMLNPELLSAEQVWVLYAQRWSIEKSFAVVKRTLGMAFLRPCHQNGMLIQIWCTLAVYQVLQDLRLEIAYSNRWNEDEVSWHNLMDRISWYAQNPTNKGTLRGWLVERAEYIYLKKRGTRKRRREGLPKEVLKECRKILPPPDLIKIKPRIARQGKPEPRKNPSILILGGLS
jgi:hypothetical protein